MPAVLDPFPLGPKVARNRVVFGPHETNLARRRSVSDRHVAYYLRRAAGGAGVVVIEEASVHPSDWPYERCPLAADAGPGWAAVAETCHAEGALVVAALGHSGGQGSSAYSQAPLWAPSRVPEVNTREVPKPMEAHEVTEVVAGFAAAASAAVGSGCDGVEVNAGQHSLVRQFLSGLTNHRSDEWGNDRLLFARQVLEAVRGGAGPDAVVGLRLSCDELAPWAGITPEDASGIAVELGAMVDYLTVVRGSIYTVSATRPDSHVDPGFNLPLTRMVREAVPIGTAIVAQGSMVDVAMAEAAVADGTCDLVEMTRAQIADPDLAAKAAAGTAGRPCILCNQTCMCRDVRNPIVTCVVEPSSGHEWEDPPIGTARADQVRLLLDEERGLARGAQPRPGPGAAGEDGAGSSRAPVQSGADDRTSRGGVAGADVTRSASPPSATADLHPSAPPPAAKADPNPPASLTLRAGTVVGLGQCGAGSPGPPDVRVPVAAHEDQPPAAAPALIRDVLVVGGGVAGMEVARVAAEVGHRVTLVERSGRLGGALRWAAEGAGRRRLALAADWLESEVRRLGVEVQLGREVDAIEVQAFDGEVVLCTGSLPGRRTYRVEDGGVVATAAEVLAGEELPEGPVLVWDPIGGPIGISVAERLRSHGRLVSLVTPDLIAGNELARSGDLAPANVRLQASGVAIERRTILRAVAPGEACVEHRFTGESRTIPAAAVVDAAYRLPDDRLWRATGEVMPRAGDAVAPRTIYEAVLEARRLALAIGATPPSAVGASAGAGGER